VLRPGTSFVAPRTGLPISRSAIRRDEWLRSHEGLQDAWHSHGLDENRNYGDGADRDRFGVHPIGYHPSASYDEELQRLLVATLAVHGSRSIGIRGVPYDTPGTSEGSAFCHDDGLHFVSRHQHGYEVLPDRSLRPAKGTSGWNGPGGEHAASALADIAWYSGDLYAEEKVLVEAENALTLVHDSYYESSGYFSERRLRRPIAQGMKAALLSTDNGLTDQGSRLVRRLNYLIDLWLTSKVQMPPQHAVRRGDEDPPGDGNTVDTWQLGLEAATWFAYAQRLSKTTGGQPLAVKILRYLQGCLEFTLDAWYAPGDLDRRGEASNYWRLPKQSSATDPRNYSSLLILDPLETGDHGLLNWLHQILTLPLELDARREAIRTNVLAAYESTRKTESRPTKWTGPSRSSWGPVFLPTPA
jgi:hypothetical protein